jgi:uncharacterized protein YbjQ (UPF0145 family)
MTTHDALSPDDLTPEEIALASINEIAAGRLPLQAQWRIAEQRARRDAGESGSFTSNLTTGEFAAIRSVGFSPVGQVMGSAVYNVGWSYTGCGYVGAYGGMRGPTMFNPSGSWVSGAPVADVPSIRNLLEQARHRAVERMRTECEGLGGDGIVGVRLTLRNFYDNGVEFAAMGTAVRADGANRPPKPFTSDLSGQDFAKLLRGGWVPVDLVMGVGAVIRHDDWAQLSQMGSWRNNEIGGLTELVNTARASARQSLARDTARRGGHSVVLQDMRLSVFESRCAYGGAEMKDHIADAFVFGTAITPLDPSGRRSQAPPPPLQMLRLNRGPKGIR